MLLFILGITWCTTSVNALIPASNVFYQNTTFSSACIYGNLTVEANGKSYSSKDCNSNIDNQDLAHPPRLLINSNNATERFTVVMLDMGPEGKGPGNIQWMVTNVSISTLPNFQNLPASSTVFSYQQPMVFHMVSQANLVQFLVLRHATTLRAPFSEIWTAGRQFFSLSKLFSNTAPNLLLCGPVAAIQFWVHGHSLTPSAPPPPLTNQPHPPFQPVYVPVVPVQPAYVPVGSAPAQPSYPPQYGQAPSQPGHTATPQQPPHMNYPKKSLGTVSEPMQLLFVPLVVLTVMYL